jgi:bidirectional [NiFe] hydrogenase diaphorase subunit
MLPQIPVSIDGKALTAGPNQTILQVARKAGIDVPVLCEMDGLSTVGACRLCLVEVEGVPKLLPACTTPVAANQKIQTDSEKLRKYRRMTLELLFAERNHVCAVCVANGHCELQRLASNVGMDFVRFPFLYPDCRLDASNEKFVMDHNRCVMCTRCVRVCDEVEGAHVWDVSGRGVQARIISDFAEPWRNSAACTFCGKCVEVCPTGALWPKNARPGWMEREPERIGDLMKKRTLL